MNIKIMKYFLFIFCCIALPAQSTDKVIVNDLITDKQVAVIDVELEVDLISEIRQTLSQTLNMLPNGFLIYVKDGTGWRCENNGENILSGETEVIWILDLTSQAPKKITVLLPDGTFIKVPILSIDTDKTIITRLNDIVSLANIDCPKIYTYFAINLVNGIYSVNDRKDPRLWRLLINLPERIQKMREAELQFSVIQLIYSTTFNYEQLIASGQKAVLEKQSLFDFIYNLLKIFQSASLSNLSFFDRMGALKILWDAQSSLLMLGDWVDLINLLRHELVLFGENKANNPIIEYVVKFFEGRSEDAYKEVYQQAMSTFMIDFIQGVVAGTNNVMAVKQSSANSSVPGAMQIDKKEEAKSDDAKAKVGNDGDLLMSSKS